MSRSSLPRYGLAPELAAKIDALREAVDRVNRSLVALRPHEGELKVRLDPDQLNYDIPHRLAVSVSLQLVKDRIPTGGPK